MTEEEFGYIVVRSDVPNYLPFAVGDPVVTYKLDEPWPFADLKPHAGHTFELEDYQKAVVLHSRLQDWRVERELHCNCRQRRTVAQLLVHIPSARRWASHKPEKIPAAFRKDGRAVPEGWVLHGAAGEMPHVGGVASCKGCTKRWLVASTWNDVDLVAVKDARHGGAVAP